jgi:hypothetical protein
MPGLRFHRIGEVRNAITTGTLCKVQHASDAMPPIRERIA